VVIALIRSVPPPGKVNPDPVADGQQGVKDSFTFGAAQALFAWQSGLRLTDKRPAEFKRQ